MNSQLDFSKIFFLLFILSLCTFKSTFAVLTENEFNAAVKSCGYPAPAAEVYQNFVESTADFSRDEAAMFLAQLIYESRGFKHTEQVSCSRRNCVSEYDDGQGLPNRSYHGRGYIQLSYPDNYKKASIGLGLGENTLLEYPELLAEDKNLAMRASSWYWISRVRPLLQIGDGYERFGLTTRGINPGECLGIRYPVFGRLRYRVYERVAKAIGVDVAGESGCYN